MDAVPPSPHRESLGRRLFVGALIFLGYYALAKAGLLLATINRSASPIWPATGFAIAMLSRLGRRYWPAVTLGAFLANFQTGIQPFALAVIPLGNTLEGLVGSLLFDRITRRRRAVFGAETVLAVISAVVFATPISAAFGTFALYTVAAIGRSQILSNGLTWWTGDSLGALIFAPFFLRIFRGKRLAESLPGPRAVAVFLFSAAVAWLIFRPWAPMAAIFLAYPAIFLAVLTLKPGESGFVTLLFTGAAVWSTVSGYGPFNVGTTNDNLICLALFLASAAFTEQGLQFVRETGALRIPTIAVFAGWVIGAIVLNGFVRNEEAVDRSHFQNLVEGTMARFSQRAFLYEAGLRGGVGLFRASERVTPREWKAYVDILNIHQNYPGILGIGYVEIVPKSGLAAFTRRVRNDGEKDFTPHSIGKRSIETETPGGDHFIIVSVEPRAENGAAIGLDLASEPNRREGALRAMRTGQPEITHPIRLVQVRDEKPGFLLFLPCAGDKRRGWVYAPLLIDEFLGNTGDANGGEIGFEIDIELGGNEGRKRIFTSDPGLASPGGRPAVETVRTLWGQTMIFRWFRTPKFESRHDTTSAWVTFTCAILNILLCAFVAILASLTRKANELAERQAREIRAQQAKLEHSSRLATLGEMAGGIAHEINNPLAILSGRALLLFRLAEGTSVDPDMVRQNSTKILETVERMARIISGLRSFSRNGERDPFRPVALAKIFAATLDFCSERFRNQQIELRVTAAPEIELVCREVQVVQVLLNLLNNAFDAVLPMSDRWIALEAKVAPNEVRFTVTDSGAGIPPEVAENMMTPFFTTKPVGQGTGLGLSISSGIAEEHAGSLRYEPTADGRTRFAFAISRGLSSGSP